ncbi:hypothetical protein F5X96DRAFT_636543 [Biscogniauxia mediterranea]|nr:hypothetical protein F5X96DRAFT_636543 [Biscogniauxia mediterranea]
MEDSHYPIPRISYRKSVIVWICSAMVGVRRRNRCTYCKSRKIKCDEKWPTCSPCSKSGRTCSGPPNNLTFVHGVYGPQSDGRIAEVPKNRSVAIQEPHKRPEMRLVAVRDRVTESGATFSKLRILSQAPKIPDQVSKSQSDLLASRISYYLDSSTGTGYSFGTFIGTLHYVPQLIGENQALFYATDLLLSTWLKLCRGAKSEDILDLRAYNRAIRSLQRALDNPREQKSVATLAAVHYLQTIEMLFDSSKGVNQVSHSNGIYWLLLHRGPPKPDDPLSCMLLLEAMLYLYRQITAGKIDNIFLQPQWLSAIMGFIKQFSTNNIEPLVSVIIPLASAITRFSSVYNAASDARDPKKVQELARDFEAFAGRLQALDDTSIQPLVRSGLIHETEDLESPFGSSYNFPNYLVAHEFANIIAFGIVVNRIRQELDEMMGVETPELEGECLEMSSRIWKVCRYALASKPIGAIPYQIPIAISYGAGGPKQRAYLRAVLDECEEYRGRQKSRWTEEVILAQCGIVMGMSRPVSLPIRSTAAGLQ